MSFRDEPVHQRSPAGALICNLSYQTRRFLVLRGDLALAGFDRALQPRSQIEARFDSLWQTALEPALRVGLELSFAEVEARLGPHPLLKPRRRYRECTWLGAVFIARLSIDGVTCEHLWPVPPRPDPRRLEIHFPDAAALHRFRAAAEYAHRDPDELAASLLGGFAAGAPAPAGDAGQGPLSGPEAVARARRRLPS